jgi:hypothetical protein
VLVEATVYFWDGTWRGIWQRAPDGQARILQERFENAGRAMQALDEALAEGPESQLWQEPTLVWRQNEERGYYSPLSEEAAVFVKQATSGAWYVSVTGGATLGQHGRASWFSTADEAKYAALRLLTQRSESGLEWVSHRW